MRREASGRRALILRCVRWVLGALFIYMGLTKALHPADFLKLVRQYGLLENHLALNSVAAVLPWFEVFCGLLLVIGVAARGAALAVLVMLVGFTAMVFMRAWTLHLEQGLAFCAVRFDCGCGAGEVAICGKLLENAGLAALAMITMARRGHGEAPANDADVH